MILTFKTTLLCNNDW